MKVYLNRLLVLLMLLFAISQTSAQSIPVGTIGDEYLMKPDAEFGHIFEKISQ